MSAEDWTEDRIAVLRTMKAQGHSAGQIAKMLNASGARFSRNAIIGKLKRLGLLGNGPLPKAREEQSRKLIAKQRMERERKAKPLRPPKLEPSPVQLHPPKVGPNSVRFCDRLRWQCPMFCEGQSLSTGYVCGEPTEFGRVWCSNCLKLIYAPQPPMRPVKREKAA